MPLFLLNMQVDSSIYAMTENPTVPISDFFHQIYKGCNKLWTSELTTITVTESMPQNIQACADNRNKGKTAHGFYTRLSDILLSTQ